ncbi:MAG TPA: SDR family oxidoreductase [Flavobacteriales bacterium]|nr:SDR family oxidoreductase [Flavobacteriales bacterium]HRJ34680.1 SDR family oxidoreductase [Flavobacteriales bacterium]HRJ37938.1 SDR family oxidoreductase [Flavobacteriales bacterium]
MKTVLITGTSSGIGKSTVKLFHQKGWNVIATSRNPEKEKDLKEDDRLMITALDVTKPSGIQEAISKGIARFGKIDVLVNNAGYGLVGPFEAATDEQIRRQFDTNVHGIFNTTQLILPHFREKKSGVIINVASVGGQITFPLYSLYHSTKWAVEGFSESLHYELREHGIRIKIIEPGPIKTDFYDRSQDLMKKDGLNAYDAFVSKTFPVLQKFGANASGPEIVAAKIYRAATDGRKKLRYPVGGGAGAVLFLRRILPFAVFRSIVRWVTKS